MRKLGRMRGLLAATGLSLLALGTGVAEARTNRALIIGVTDYPNLPPRAWLVGPNHDAALVRDYLLNAAPEKFDANNVTLLADKLDGAAGSPTHARILSAMKALADVSEPGDFVYIHYSGHGSQQPALDPKTETDGRDEILLPADTGNWTDRTKGVPDALVDDEIGKALDAIRDRGAFVWMVFDACQSGTATREAPVDGEDMAERKVDPEMLGIPQSAFSQAETEAGAANGASRGAEEAGTRAPPLKLDKGHATPTGAKPIVKGGLVAFFAAQTVETTPEMKLPKGAADAQKYGLFTYTIFSEIAANPNMTYRQLGAAVLQQYAADARSKPTPLFEGALDARVWGTEVLDTVMQWPLEAKEGGMSIPAGLLQRLGPGTKLAVLPSPASELTDALGYVEVKSAKNLSARVAPVAWNNKPALQPTDLPPKPYARLAELSVDFRLKVARPASSSGLEEDTRFVDAALDSLGDDADKGFNVELVPAGAADADIRLAVLPESKVTDGASEKPALFFLPPSGEVDKASPAKPPLVAIDRNDPAKLEKAAGDNLRKIFRAVGLSRLAAASDYRPSDVAVTFSVKPEGSDTLLPLDGANVPVVHPGDEVHLRAENKSTKNVDLNVLYVGSDWSVTHITAERLVPGAAEDEGLLAFTDTSFGPERMIAVLTEAPPLSETEDLSFLAQDGVAAATRDASERGGFSAMLGDIGAAPSTRSVMRLADKEGPKGAVMIFPLETAPRE